MSASNVDNFEPRYRFQYQEYGRTRKTVNPRNAHSVDETLFEKIIKIKWWLFGMILVLIFGGAVVGLSIFFTKTKASTMSEIRPYIVSTPSLVSKPHYMYSLHVFTPGKCNHSDQCDNGRNMCNFDGETYGFCENCAYFKSPEDCQETGFITARGFDNCIKHCTGIIWIDENN